MNVSAPRVCVIEPKPQEVVDFAEFAVRPPPVRITALKVKVPTNPA
jgi:hypothetical protein